MFIAGLLVAIRDVQWLVAELGHCDTATRLAGAIERQEAVTELIYVALDDTDLRMILLALDDPPTDDLATLRGLLMRKLTSTSPF